MPSRKDGLPSIWDNTHGLSGNVFADPVAFSATPHPQELNPWSSHKPEPIHSSQAGKNDNQTPVQDQRCQSDSQPKIHSSSVEETLQSIMGQTNNDWRSQNLHFDKFPTPSTCACWKIRFKTEVCTCSQFPTEAMHWIKEVEMVDSVDDLKSSCSVRGIQMPKFNYSIRGLLQH